METTKNLGIWMDHSIANLIDLNAKKKSHSINSEFTFETKEVALVDSEKTMHNKRQQMHEEFYKKIADEILEYNHVLLFGPTNAKTELHNFLNEDLHFKDIKIDIEAGDKMTENQQVAFVRGHFEK
ncbi:hypothetical protein SAMN05421847_2129 [Halpernia humi]|uniref:Uncharacterized protein n=1 Tax=Halpernia humi TaxID=493375 RepID=A0A1H5ZQY0_9FLAO|nr:hypothetical protein [Halpernia humi]SEG38165.1 hypothetical protein SAMN05421847_2129 [Halpernia humi]